MKSEYDISIGELFDLIKQDRKYLDALIMNVCPVPYSTGKCPLTNKKCDGKCDINLKKRLRSKKKTISKSVVE